MARVILEGGTDVAEVALFCLDDVPQRLSDDETVAEMQSRNSLVRFPTGSDGGYLLHLYVDEPVSDKVWPYCVKDDKLTGEFFTKSGRVGFGGLESTYAEFSPNKNIREDGEIGKGRYTYSAFHTDYPDGLVESAILDKVGDAGMRKLDIPRKIVVVSAVLFLAFVVIGFRSNYAFFFAAAGVLALGILGFRTYTSADSYKRLGAQKQEVERQYPSIVMQLESNSA